MIGINMEKRGKTTKAKKRAESHLEMIISFSIFLIFLLFLFTYMNPVKKPDLSSVLLDIIEKEAKNYTIDLLEMPVMFDQTPIVCFNIECPFNLSYIPPADQGKRRYYVFVEDDEQNDKNFGFIGVGNSLNITIDPAGATSNLYTLYFSDSIFNNFPNLQEPLSSNCLSPGQYSFSTPRLKNLYSYSKLTDLNTSYYFHYDELKKRFNFPESNDFAIFISPYFEMSGIKPERGLVKAREIPIEMIREENNQKQIIKTYLNIQVW